MDSLLFCLKGREVTMQQPQNVVRAIVGEIELWQYIGLGFDYSVRMVREGFLEEVASYGNLKETWELAR